MGRYIHKQQMRLRPKIPKLDLDETASVSKSFSVAKTSEIHLQRDVLGHKMHTSIQWVGAQKNVGGNPESP